MKINPYDGNAFQLDHLRGTMPSYVLMAGV
jgi:hypothetical protein